MTDEELLMRADYLLTLVLNRESAGLTNGTKSEINSLLRNLRPRTDQIARKWRKG